MKITKKLSILSLSICLALVLNTMEPLVDQAYAALGDTPTQVDFSLIADNAINDNTAAGVELSWGAGPGGTTKYRAYRRLPVSQGTLSAIESNSPNRDILIAGSSDNTVAQYDFSATGEDFIVNKLTIINDPTGPFDIPLATSAVSQVTLECSDSEGSPASYSGALAGGSAALTGLDCLVEAGTPATFTVKADITDMATGGEGLSGQVFRLGIRDTGNSSSTFNATGQSSFIMENSPTITNGVNVNTFVVRKTKPASIVKAAGLSGGMSNGENRLYGFTISAPDLTPSNGSLTLSRIVLDLTAAGLASAGNETLNTFKLYRGGTLLASETEIYGTNNAGNNVVDISSDGAGGDLDNCDGVNGNGIADGTYKIIISFNGEESIANGASQSYYLDATVSNATSNDDLTVSIASGDDDTELAGLSANTNANTGKIYVNGDVTSGIFTAATTDFSQLLGTGRNFIWSDKSATSHSYPTVVGGSVTTNTGSYDYTNGYLLDLASISDHSLLYLHNDPFRMFAYKVKDTAKQLANLIQMKGNTVKTNLIAFWNNLKGIDLSVPNVYADTTDFAQIGEMTGTAYDDFTCAGGTTYDYIIEALDDSNVVQGYSDVVNISCSSAPIAVTSAITGDTNGDGTVDQMTFNFSEAVDIVDDAGVIGLEASLVLGSNCVLATSDYDDTNTSSLVAVLTGCDAGTNLIPTVNYTKVANCATDGSICRNGENTLMSTQNLTATDGVVPNVTNVTPNDTTITDADVGAGNFHIDIDYSESMAGDSTPSVTFTPDLVTSGTLTLSGTSSWQDADTYRAVYDVADVDEAQTLTDIDITSATDAGGNTQAVYNGGGEGVTVDTTNPTLSSWSLNMGARTLTMNFDESVDAGSLDVTGITVQDAATATTSYTLTDSNTASGNGAAIVVDLSNTDFNALTADAGLATSQADSWLTITAAVIDDLSGNPVTAIVDTAGLQAASYGGNTAPTASSVNVTGTLTIGQVLTGNYTYADVDTDAEGTSTFKWYRADDAGGTNKAQIAGETTVNYTLANDDLGKFISFEVTPVAATGTTPGVAVESTAVGAISNKPVANTTQSTYHDTVQDAIDNAIVGDSITVADGTYTENITVDKSLTLTGNTGTPANVVLEGAHTITASDVTLTGFTLTPGTGVPGTVLTLDSSASVLSDITVSSGVITMDTSPSVGIYVGGACTNPVSNITLTGLTFNGPTNMVSNPWKIGGSFGAGISCQVTNLDFTNSTVNYGSIPVNLQNSNLTDILVNNNTFRNTDGALYVWTDQSSSPTGVLSQFVFTNNDLDSTNSYGLAFMDHAVAGDTLTDANFGTGNQVRSNSFVSIPGAYGLTSVSMKGNFTSYSMDATRNWWGAADGPSGCTSCGGSGDAISDDVSYFPYYTDAGKTTLSDITYTSGTSGQADMPAGVTDVELTDDIVMDISGSMSTAAGGNIDVGGVSTPLNNFTSGDLTGTDLSAAQTVGTAAVTIDKAVKLESGTNGQPVSLTNSDFSSASVSIPDGTTIMGPAGWDGKLLPPKSGGSGGNAPSSFSVGSTIVEVGSANGVLLLDKPASVIIDGVHTYVGYKPAGSTQWTKINTTCTGTYASPTAPTFPNECYISDAGLDKTKIYTWHFTTFSNLSYNAPVTPAASTPVVSSGGGGGAGTTARLTPADDSNTQTSRLSSTISKVIDTGKTITRPLKISSHLITADAVERIKTTQLTGEEGTLTLKPNKLSTIGTVFPENTTITSTFEWDGDIQPPLLYSVNRVSKLGGEIENSNQKLYREDVAAVVKVGSNDETLTFSNKVKLEVPLEEVEDGTRATIYSSPFGHKWTREGTATVQDGKVMFETDHFSYFAIEAEGGLRESAPLERFIESTTGFADIRNHWAEQYINNIADLGIVSGKSATQFAPDDNITRAELTKVAINAFGLEVSESVADKPFNDVSASAWFAPYIQTAKSNGIVRGVAGGNFAPNESITRSAALKVLIEAAGFEGVDENLYQNYVSKPGWWYVHFPDVAIGEWYDKYVAYARDYGIVGGYADGTFRPGNPITRAEVAKVVTKIMELREAVEEPTEEMDEGEGAVEEPVAEEEPAEE